MDLVWCEVHSAVLSENIQTLKKILSPGAKLGCVVKSNAYGHGLLVAARAFVEGGADWLIVQSVQEAKALRDDGYEGPLLIIGFVPASALELVRECRAEMTVYDLDIVGAAGKLPAGEAIPMHIKVETGNYRQGLEGEDVLILAKAIDSCQNAKLSGMSTHFANVEDTTDHSYADGQLKRFEAVKSSLAERGFDPPIKHVANSAATVLWPECHMDLVRVGIIAYGLWPSPQTLVSTVLNGRHPIKVRPALTWKASISQVKWVPMGGFIGYGCTYKVSHRTRIAIVPVGYYEGYVRHLSNLAYVLVGGKRAPVRGRVCMNFIMVDVTDIPDTKTGEEVVLLGQQGDESISAEQLADWSRTINYEVTTRISQHLPRYAVI